MLLYTIYMKDWVELYLKEVTDGKRYDNKISVTIYSTFFL